MATSVVQAYVTKAVDMVEDVRHHLPVEPLDAERSDAACAPFRLESIELNVAPYEMTGGIARQIMRLRALGIRFHHLHVRIIQHEPDEADTTEDTTDRDQLLSVLLAPPSDAPADDEAMPFAFETLSLDRADLVQFSAACTALEATQTVKNLQLQNAFTFDMPTERTLKWEWLTRAVLAPSSRTSIQHVSINQTEIELSDVDAVRSALLAMAQESAEGSHALDTLAIGSEASEAETIEAIPLLLGLIGRHLSSLSIYLWMGSLTTDTVVRSQQVCPNLLFLDLSSVELDSMNVFLDVYDRGNCRIRSLALHNVEVPNDSVTAFALALCDPRRRAGQVLRELCIDSVGHDNALDQANLDGFYALLQAHGSPLTYLDLRVPEPLLPANRSRFVALHNTWGAGVAAPLSILCKAAFVSVGHGPRPEETNEDDATASCVSSRMGLLDPHVVTMIFDFAATRSWRNVHIDGP